MADIRIKDLATTASSAASDDFMALDGTTNGTRKMSAANPSVTTLTTSGVITPGGSVHGANGSAANPSFAFNSDQNTGLYRIGPDNIGVAANGAKVLDIATTGLTVTGAVSVSSTTAASSGVGALIVQGGISAGQSAQASFIGGNLTVGAQTGALYLPDKPDSLIMSLGYPATSTPTNQQLKISLGNVSGTEAYGFTTDNSARVWYHAGNSSSGSGGHVLATGGTARLTIDSTTATFAGAVTAGVAAFDRLGINSNPINTVSTAQSFARFQSTGADFYTGTESNTPGGFFPSSTAYAAVLYNSAATPMHFYTSGTLRATISAAGDATFAGAVTVTGALKLGNAYVAGVVVGTGSITIQDSTGTTYRIPVLV